MVQGKVYGCRICLFVCMTNIPSLNVDGWINDSINRSIDRLVGFCGGGVIVSEDLDF